MNSDYWIARAEIAYKCGNTSAAIRAAKNALKRSFETSKRTAILMFIARAYSKSGKLQASNHLYRQLINEKNYIPPIIMGLLYNNFKMGALQKVINNLGLIKIYLRQY